jgi:5'-nucleotidase
VIVGDQYTRGSTPVAVAEPERSQITAALAANPNVLQVAPDPEAQQLLDEYAAQVTELSKRVVGSVSETLCSRRVPDRVRSTSFPQCLAPDTTDGDPTDVVSVSGARMSVNGGFSQQVVTQAFRARSFRADIALQNGGGVRTDIAPGPLTVGQIYNLLPFNNTLVELEMTGTEIEQVLEEALTNYLNNGGSDGSYPYGADIRWRVDESQPAGSRVSTVEVKADDGSWSAIDPTATYVVVTNSFLADGRDGWTTFGTVKASGRFVDTFIGYAQALLDYVEQDLGGGALTVPAPADFSTQAFISN